MVERTESDVVQLTKFRPFRSRPVDDHQSEAPKPKLGYDSDFRNDMDTAAVLAQIKQMAWMLRHRHGNSLDIDNRLMEAILSG